MRERTRRCHRCQGLALVSYRHDRRLWWCPRCAANGEDPYTPERQLSLWNSPPWDDLNGLR